jgi:hypothetical protein
MATTRRLLRSGLACVAYEGDGERFAALFRSAWRAIPPPDRRRILRYWSARTVGPSIEFMGWWSSWRPGVRGQVGLRAMQVRFHAPYVDLMTDDDARFTICHELTHVLQWAERRGSGSLMDLSQAQVERDANVRAFAWLGLSRRPRISRALRAYIFSQAVEALRHAD